MDERIKTLMGSPARDRFKWLHKQQAPGKFYAINSDLELVSKHPRPFIVARLDFKLRGDTVSFAEVISYNQLILTPMPYFVPVYVIECLSDIQDEPDTHLFNIYRYEESDPYPFPPDISQTTLCERVTWLEFVAWERQLRVQRMKEMADWLRQHADGNGRAAEADLTDLPLFAGGEA